MKKLLLILLLLFPVHSAWADSFDILMKDIKKTLNSHKNMQDLYYQGVECELRLLSTSEIKQKQCSNFLENWPNSSDETTKLQTEFNQKYTADKIKSWVLETSPENRNKMKTLNAELRKTMQLSFDIWKDAELLHNKLSHALRKQ